MGSKKNMFNCKGNKERGGGREGKENKRKKNGREKLRQSLHKWGGKEGLKGMEGNGKKEESSYVVFTYKFPMMSVINVYDKYILIKNFKHQTQV